MTGLVNIVVAAVLEADRQDRERKHMENVMPDRDAAIRNMREITSVPDWCVIDTETTGLEGYVWQVAVIDGPTGVPRLLLNLPVPQGASWSEKAAEYHDAQGLTAKHLHVDTTSSVGLITLKDVLRQYRHVVAYNAKFDRERLRSTYNAWHCPFVPDLRLTWHCAAEAYAPAMGRLRSSGGYKMVKLEEALREEGLQHYPNAHHALWDALVTHELVTDVAAQETNSEREERELLEDVERQKVYGVIEYVDIDWSGEVEEHVRGRYATEAEAQAEVKKLIERGATANYFGPLLETDPEL